ncbi:MAG: hypothetical protein RLY86_3838 [Pseudomonadota bacterium]|jgi:2-methylcitrate dehydratase PrpD
MSLARHLARHLRRPVPAELRRRVALHVLDWTGCAVAGSATPVALSLRRALTDGGEGTGPCTAIGLDRGLPLETAARMNGALGNILEMDDVDKRARLHPGPVVIPAALAVAEWRAAAGCPVAGPDLADALMRGYEATVRLGRALGDAHYRHWHSTATCGTVGAAVAAADLLGLDEGGLTAAITLAVTRTGGLWETRNDPASAAKQIHTAQAAGDGIFAARCAAAGLTGPATMLEGGEGLFAATAPGRDPGVLLADLERAGRDGDGHPWCLTEISLKPWPACRHAHPAIDAALAILDRIGRPGLAAGEVATVTVTTYGDALRFCDRPVPETVGQAKFSLQHAVAVTLLRGAPDLAAFDPPAIADHDVATLRTRVNVQAGDPWAGRYPDRFGCGMTITMADGGIIFQDMPDALGDPENPLTEDRVVAKAMTLMEAGGMGMAAAAALCAAALTLDEPGPRGGVLPLMAALPRGRGE